MFSQFLVKHGSWITLYEFQNAAREFARKDLGPMIAPFFIRCLLFSGSLNELCKSGNGANVPTESEGNLHGIISVLAGWFWVLLWKDVADCCSLTP